MHAKQLENQLKRTEMQKYVQAFHGAANKARLLNASRFLIIPNLAHVNNTVKKYKKALIYTDDFLKLALAFTGSVIALELKKKYLEFQIWSLLAHTSTRTRHKCHSVKEPVQIFNMYFLNVNAIQHKLSKAMSSAIEFGIYNFWKSRVKFARQLMMTSQSKTTERSFTKHMRFLSETTSFEDFLNFKNIIPVFLLLLFCHFGSVVVFCVQFGFKHYKHVWLLCQWYSITTYCMIWSLRKYPKESVNFQIFFFKTLGANQKSYLQWFHWIC